MSEPTLDSLRAQGVHHHDPVRFYYLEALSRRLRTQPGAVQKVLASRLDAAVADYSECAKAAAPAPFPAAAIAAGQERTADAARQRPEHSELAQLNRDLQVRAQSDAHCVLRGDSANGSEMKSVRQFSEVWAKISAAQTVVQALHRGPENPGPLNAHKLMLRSLGLMQTLAPDYLRRFLSQMDSLMWLEQMNTQPERSGGRRTRGGRSRP